MREFLELLWRIWWLRGAVAAIGLLHFAHQFLGYSVFEAAGAVLAVLGLWQECMRWLGGLVGRLPFIPPLSASQMLYLSLLASFSVPVALHASRDVRQVLRGSELQSKLSGLEAERDQLRGKRSAWLKARLIERRVKRLRNLSQPGALVLAVLLLLAALTSTGLLAALALFPNLPLGLGAGWIAASAVGVGFALACRQSAYRVGVVMLGGFVLGLQLAYWADAPGTRDFVQRQASLARAEPES